MLITTISRPDDLPAEAAEILRKRAEAHAAACAGMDDDPLIRAAFGPFEEPTPIRLPTQNGWMFRRQAG